MATSTTALVTVEQFRQMEDPPGFRLELHGGEVVAVSRPSLKHAVIQKRLAGLLAEVWGHKGWSATEIPFRGQPEHDLRVAHVAWVSKARYDLVDPKDFLHGSPEIVVEVLSPSNTAGEWLHKKDLCLSSGCLEFWSVSAERSLIEVTRVDSAVHVYRRGNRVPIGNESSFLLDEMLSD